jgi:hypothetical protein
VNNSLKQMFPLSSERQQLLMMMLQEKGIGKLHTQSILRRNASRPWWPLSFAQQRLWFLDQLMPGNPFYNVSTAVRLRGALQIDALERSLHEVVKRHESLRTTFSEMNGQPVQIISSVGRLEMKYIDLRCFRTHEREERIRELANREAQRPFDLTHGPLLRTSLLLIEKEEHVLLLSMHHIISDGWSTNVLMREIAKFYIDLAQGRSSHLPTLPIQYADYALWQRQQLQGEVLHKHVLYWQRRLHDLPELILPTDHSRPPVLRLQGAHHSFRLSSSLSSSLRELSQRENVTLFMTLLAAFQVLLAGYSGQEDIVIGVPTANRTRAETEGLIGFFLNTLVLRTDLSGDPRFCDLLSRVREITLEAYMHQELPFEKLVEVLRPERSANSNPLFQVMFVLQNTPLVSLKLPGLILQLLEANKGTAKLDLILALRETKDGLFGDLEYSTELFEARTIAKMAQHFETILSGCVAHPESNLSALLCMTADNKQLVNDFNDQLEDDGADVIL